jgi:hypothetical protein
VAAPPPAIASFPAPRTTTSPPATSKPRPRRMDSKVDRFNLHGPRGAEPTAQRPGVRTPGSRHGRGACPSAASGPRPSRRTRWRDGRGQLGSGRAVNSVPVGLLVRTAIGLALADVRNRRGGLPAALTVDFVPLKVPPNDCDEREAGCRRPLPALTEGTAPAWSAGLRGFAPGRLGLPWVRGPAHWRGTSGFRGGGARSRSWDGPQICCPFFWRDFSVRRSRHGLSP